MRYNAALLRRVFTLASALSLLFAAATAWFWVSGNLLGWKAVWERTSADGRSKSTYTLEISGGGIAVIRDGIFEPLPPPFSADERSWKRTNGDECPRAPVGALSLGQWAAWSDNQPVGHGMRTVWGIIFPCWALFVFAVGTAALLWWKRGHVGRPRGTACRQCGYDLRATPDRCPECGTPADKTAEAST